MMFYKINFLVLMILLMACRDHEQPTLQPKGMIQEKSVTLEKGDLKVTFVDNDKMGDIHKAGYNGIAELFHSQQDSTLFVPFYAGFNLEHIFGGDSLVQLFEPRKHPMSLYRKSNHEALLYQHATPLSGVESLTEFKLVAPHYIDITFRCVLHHPDFFKHDYAGFFWASYINKPPDKKIYFKSGHGNPPTSHWIEAYSNKHGVESTHKAMDDAYEFFFADKFNATLANHFSEYRYAAPFYYGKFHNMAFAYLFESKEIIRFSQSPTGGGQTNPAWDFQYLIPDPKAGKEYSFKARLIYKSFLSAGDIEREYNSWINRK